MFFSGLLVSAVLLAPPDALQTLSRDASAVAQGTVVSVSSRWSSDHRIITDIVFEVTTALKNARKGDRLRLLHRGGEIEGLTQKVSGVPDLKAGEDVVLFLEQRPGQRYRVRGEESGVWRIQSNATATSGQYSLTLSELHRRIASAAPSSRQSTQTSNSVSTQVQP